jgi:3-hydroxybutyryl-CoA dehydrogenase
MDYVIKQSGESRSFPPGDRILAGAVERGDVLLLVGPHAGRLLAEVENPQSWTAILVELGTECLGVYTGESRGQEGSNVLGFARFRLGEDAPTKLVELVRQPNSSEAAIAAAQQLFGEVDLQVAVCQDFAGRIIDRLVRPYYNEALRRLDEKLATANDMDLTLRLGLGYPEGPISLLERSGLAHHFDVTQALFEAYGQSAYAPARRARVAKQRAS